MAETTPEQREPRYIGGSVGLIRLAGIPLRLHFTFLLLLAFLAFISFRGQMAGVMTAVFILGIFVSVVLHELGHALAARKYGIETVEIVLFPIGGVARLERLPKAREELWIALAGPLVNVVIAAAVFAGMYLRGGLGIIQPVDQMELTASATPLNLLQRLAIANLILAVFNLLPAFPMDGGRVLRAVVSLWKGEATGTRVAVAVGQMMAIAMGLYGLLSQNYILIFIAFFVYLGADQEGNVRRSEALTEGVPVRMAMVTDFRTLSHGDRLRDAADLLLATTQSDFPVLFGDDVTGLLGRNDLLRGMAQAGPDSYVSEVMVRDFVRLAPDLDLSAALGQMSQAGGSCALVMEDGRLLGLLTAENLNEFLLLRQVNPSMGAGRHELPS